MSACRTVALSSKELVWARITERNGEDISAATITLATILATGGEPAAIAYAAPDQSEVVSPSVRRVAVLVGPGTAHILPKGVYALWYKLLDAPEAIAEKAGIFQIGG